MAGRNRGYLAFGDLRVGDVFRFRYGALLDRVSPDRLVKVSPCRYRVAEHEDRFYATGAGTAVTLVEGPSTGGINREG